ncbi:MAG: NirD/YgiW/YdeI family stress tolerance protein [Treponema sp.]|jgi:uncharacterized protein (TIGR00156 family)|nr:NirD/YgiW/YdeI family stress tolerance protein [Treponema sp.]
MNKKLYVYAALAAILACTSPTLNAQEGYKGPGADVVTVAEAKTLRDDYPVIVRGKIERYLGDEKYVFADDTGTIIIEIDDRLWRGISVDQNDTVEILGEVDRGFTRVEIRSKRHKKDVEWTPGIERG